MKKILILIIVILLGSCVSLTVSQCIASYTIGLKSVSAPLDAKEQYGETKVVNFVEGGITKYRYTDDYIDIVWVVGDSQFDFVLRNKSGHSIKVNWDDVCFVDHNGQTSRVMHSGVKYSERENSQPASTIPNGASITDLVLPTSNVYYSKISNSWKTSYLIPCVYDNKSIAEANASKYLGKTLTVLMPILIKNVQNDYTFVFSIDKLEGYSGN